MLAAACLVALCLPVESRAQSPGALDTSFNTTGKVTTNLGNDGFGGPDDDTGRAIATQSDGKIVVAGSARNNGNYDFAVVRYNADGTLDTTFDTDGKVLTSVSASGDDMAYGLVIQPSDQKIIVVGASGADFAVVRYNTNGSLDTSFSGDGKLTTDFGGNESAKSVIMSGSSIVVAGRGDMGGGLFVARYSSTGTLDTTFDTDGKVSVATGTGFINGTAAIALQTDSKIVLAADGNDDFVVVRLTTTGGLDPAFGTNGMVSTNFTLYDEGRSLALQSDGKIVVAGRTYDGTNPARFAVARYETNGALDASFGTAGKLTTTFGSTGGEEAYAVAIQSDGRIVTAGFAFNGTAHDFAVCRHTANGTLDATFDGDGKVLTSFGSNGSDFYVGAGMSLQPDGRILVAGYSMIGGDQNFAVARYLAKSRVVEFNLTSNPGWTVEGAWAFGVPTGGGSFNHDPTSGRIGSNVYGFNLAGDYTNSLPAPLYLTSTSVDCSNHANVKLGFWRWLGVEGSDQATVQVSRDGSSWTTVYNNNFSTVSDARWQFVEYNISAVADGQSTVFVRWGMGTTNATTTYPGWNIDDIEFTGEPGFSSAVTIAATDSSAAEPFSNTGRFQLTRTGSLVGALPVNVVFSGTATPGTDYSTVSVPVTIPALASTVDFTIAPLDDLTAEGSETVIATVTAGTGYVPGTTASATVTITDNDQATVTAVATDPAAAETVSDTGLFTLTRTGGNIGMPLTVNCAITGTASSGSDFGAIPSTVTFSANATTVTVPVTVLEDAVFDPNETVILTVATASGADYLPGSPASATVTITDNEDPVVTITPVQTTMTEGGGTASFYVSRTGPLTASLVVSLSVLSGETTAISSDYSGLPASVTLGIGVASTSATPVTLTAQNDATAEVPETLTVRISSSSLYNIGGTGKAAFTIQDNEPAEVLINATTSSASESGLSGVVTLTRRGSLASSLTVGIAYSGTATIGTDVPALPASATFPTDTSTLTLSFPGLEDTDLEGTETVISTLQAGAGYTVATPSSATVLIADNEYSSFSTVNVDLLYDNSSTIYSGDQGVLSTAGNTLWNGLTASSPVSTTGMTAQSGTPTKVEVFRSLLSSIVSGGGGSAPYDSGFDSGTILQIMNLDPTKTYDLAVYFNETGASCYASGGSGTQSLAMTATRSLTMPGIEGADYLLFRNVAPAFFTSGHFGIEFGTSYYVVGFQIRQSALTSISTNAATSVASSSASLNGTVNADSLSTTITFEFGFTAAYGSTVTAVQSPLSGGTATPVGAAITGLVPGATYNYRVVATNSAGMRVGGNRTFTTPLAGLSSNADLSALALSSGTLAPTFSAATLSYAASVSNSATLITVTPTKAEANATIQARVNSGTFATITSGSASGALPLNVGSNTIDVRVTAQDATTIKTYSITVTRQSAAESWRQTWFGTTANSGNAADNFDYDHDGLVNLAEYAFGLDPTQGSSNQLPSVQMSGGNFVLSFTQPASVNGVTYGAEWSTTMASPDWHAITDTGASPQHTFSVPVGANTKLFIRLKVTGQ